MKGRDSFAKITKRKVKIAAGLNMHGEIIMMIHKNNSHAEFPMHKADET